jgi:UDP-N-acetylglucosamine 2-epimerase (non-hydrolysing)
MKNILFVFGTRPEAIKMAPVIKEFQKNKFKFNVKICVTGQHKEMLEQVLDFFEIKYDYNLAVMKKNQTLAEVTTAIINQLDKILKKESIDLILVQGDTTTAYAGAVAAFYNKIKIGHIEAGLRSHDLYSPFPEEANRAMISRIGDFHFAPTTTAAKNLYHEGIRKHVYVTGNTVIDALQLTLKKIKKEKFHPQHLSNYMGKERIILVTGHRRESFGKPFEDFCKGILKIAGEFPDVTIVYPVHFNPNVRKTVQHILGKTRNIHLIEPLDYPSMIWMMQRSHFIITDSGGIQEEGPSLKKPILVTRKVTERMEGIQSGTSKLVGTDTDTIYRFSKKLLTQQSFYDKMANRLNPYGEGNSSEQIAKIISRLP